MTKHFVLKLNPNAKFEWERCLLHNPITAEQPSFADLVAEAIGGEAGSYLVAITLEVNVLEQEPLETITHCFPMTLPEELTVPRMANAA